MSRYTLTVAILSAVVLALAILSLAAGPAGISVVQGLSDMLHGRETIAATIIGQIRLPRMILALLIGETLGLSGAALQGLVRNPLADPGVLGISGCGALGAVLVFYTGVSAVWAPALPLAALSGAGLATLLLLALTRGGTLVLVLAGAALGSMSAALLALTLNLVPSPYASYEIMHWLMGSLSRASLHDVLIATPGLLIGSALLFSTGRSLDALTLGEDVAQTMGFPLRAVQWRVVLGTALAVGSGVAVAGGIGFVGLVMPHLLRPLAGARPSRLLLPSALGGAALLLAADLFVRLPVSGAELQLGVVTSLIGTPVFFWQVWRLRGRPV
ncbi:FecCD family ABC transporter permease [Gluconobacter oxydans]|uniref:Ferrichrome ABC transporter permease protein n=2 Tax=Gluconobacter oxydans TaxID=442 RepID=Q5FS62_GLUOX|nr:iron ABC transporter permease [Gluconobacter oxydans]AAW60784.1 Ferrichrome ABC transporter permease protein [Gluconobacter oxydans 621H]KXV30830.1 ABC transporter permease [Gluconobacter oxydans]MBF0855584.1 iron ABC transporter permease [Gluconobacter oxydans]TCW24771.1 iron complex transport system permease protein [Gluconobacter oxydans]GEC61363.1 ABC transporter permease [Gluconobacter oxydans]